MEVFNGLLVELKSASKLYQTFELVFSNINIIMRRWIKVVRNVFCSLLAFYLIFYFVIDLNGSYKRSTGGSMGEIGYTWAPFGFYDEKHSWNSTMVLTFYPLWYLDICYIHKSKIM